MDTGRLTVIASILSVLTSCADTTGYAETTPADKLVMRLEMQVEAGRIMYGHQDDLMYGHSW